MLRVWDKAIISMDRSVLVLGETGSGKTEAIKVLAHQMQTTPAEPFVIFDYKQDYQQFYEDSDTIRISIQDSTQFWNVFREIETEDEFEEIARMLFEQNEEQSKQVFFPQAARQLTVASMKYVYREYDTPSNEVFAQFIESRDVETLHEKLTEYDDIRATASSHHAGITETGRGVFATFQVVLESIFTGDFGKDGSFSIREHMKDLDGQKLILDSPIEQGEHIKPLYQLFIDWSIRYGLADERKSYYPLDEFSVLPRFDMLERLIDARRSYNCYAILGVQSIAQMRTRYDAETDSLPSGLAQEIHLRVRDRASFEY